jgi:hypothetical protein
MQKLQRQRGANSSASKNDGTFKIRTYSCIKREMISNCNIKIQFGDSKTRRGLWRGLKGYVKGEIPGLLGVHD